MGTDSRVYPRTKPFIYEWNYAMHHLTRRTFGVVAGTSALGAVAPSCFGQQDAPTPAPQPVEAIFERDYEAPKFQPSWKKPQINRQLAQDFVIFAHSDLDKVKALLDRESGLLNAAIDWGAGDWETGLGGASHMGRVDIVQFLLSRGARIDIFCAAMLGQLEVVKTFLALQPALIDAAGPHGFSLHFHARAGGDAAKETLEYLQSIKPIELRPFPVLNKKETTDSTPK